MVELKHKKIAERIAAGVTCLNEYGRESLVDSIASALADLESATKCGPKTQPQKINEITAKVANQFACFGGKRKVEGNPIATAFENKPPLFALGVDVREVVSFVLTEAARENN